MPLTPFIGLSVLIHLAVIAVNKLFIWTPKPESLIKVNTKTKQFFTFIIIAFVFGFVLSNAAVLIKVSLTEKHSSFRLMDNYFFNPRNNSTIATIATIPNTLADTHLAAFGAFAQDNKLLSDNCTQLNKEILDRYGGSIKRYMKDSGRDNSLQARLQVAKNFGIKEYRGTADQNRIFLLELLKQDYVQNYPFVAGCKI